MRNRFLLILLSFLVAIPAAAATKEEKRVADATDVIDRLEPDLTLTGLRLVYDDHRDHG